MASIRKYELTKKDLVDNGYFVEGDKVFKQCNSRRWGHGVKEIKQQIITGKHKYGIDKGYVYVSLRIERLINGKKQKPIGLHNIIYAWYKGEVPLGYDVDHIDNNPFNNNIDNLQLLTHEENLQKRSIKGVNQWYYINGYDEESWSKRQQELIDKENNRKLRKKLIEDKKKANEIKKQLRNQLRIQYKDIRDNLELQIKEAKNSGDKKRWHELVQKRMSLKEYINKCMEEC